MTTSNAARTQYGIEIAAYNSAGIRDTAKEIGVQYMREVARHGEGSNRLVLFALPHPNGYEIRVIDTNGDPIWEEDDQAVFNEVLELMGVE
jgi:hypothetical protein